MTWFTRLEQAVLHSIFSETPHLVDSLEGQLEAASVTKRENTGAGFFTTITVPVNILQASTPRILGYETYARVFGLEHGLGFVLFMKDGTLDCLEGFTGGPESTARLNLFDLDFEVLRQPIQRIT